MVAVSVDKGIAGERTQGISFVLSLFLDQKVAVEDLWFPEFQCRAVFAQQRFGEDDLVEQAPLALVREGTNSFAVEIPHRVVEPAGFHFALLAFGIQHHPTAFVDRIVIDLLSTG